MELQTAQIHGEGKASKMSRALLVGNVTQLKSVSLQRPVGVVGNYRGAAEGLLEGVQNSFKSRESSSDRASPGTSHIFKSLEELTPPRM